MTPNTETVCYKILPWLMVHVRRSLAPLPLLSSSGFKSSTSPNSHKSAMQSVKTCLGWLQAYSRSLLAMQNGSSVELADHSISAAVGFGAAVREPLDGTSLSKAKAHQAKGTELTNVVRDVSNQI